MGLIAIFVRKELQFIHVVIVVRDGKTNEKLC
jgi:hypothetical protein